MDRITSRPRASPRAGSRRTDPGTSPYTFDSPSSLTAVTREGMDPRRERTGREHPDRLVSRMRELERHETDTNGARPALEGGRPKLVRTVADLHRALAAVRKDGSTIGLVPTMGAFHEGHLSLIRRARSECDVVVVSLFVNPTQFGPTEDLTSYPHDEDRDLALAVEEGVDVLFAPAEKEVYPDGPALTVEVHDVGTVLCGAPDLRGPGHFRGVATVVAKLFDMVRPDVAYFGQKDFQQTLVIKQLVRDLGLPVRIEVCPTVRDRDGLALSSRNAYLAPAERERALSLNRALAAAAATISAGGTREQSLAAAASVLEDAGVVPEYLEILRAADLRPPRWAPAEEVVIAVAARIGRARLIDNSVFKLPVLVFDPTPVDPTPADPAPA
jgi:pantoate--beta-alanine ligase